MDPVTQYALDVVSFVEPAGGLVRQACQRHIDDLEREDVFFDAKKAELVFEFIGLCKHHKGKWAGTPLRLEPAQKFIIGSIFGWKRTRDNLRRFRTVYVELPRKNGKSTLLSAVSLVLLIADNEPGAEIYSAATKEEQAKIVWGDAGQMLKKSAAMAKATKILHKSILFQANGSTYKPLGADSKTQDGLNPHAVICDELHAWKGRDLWDVLEDAFGSRSQPLMMAITTAGVDKYGICYQQRQHVVTVLDPNSKIEDDSYFGYIATIDEEDKQDPNFYLDPKIWRKANPMLGVSKNPEYMEDLANKAKAMPGKMATFLTKQLNVWTDGHNLMWNMGHWDKGALPIEFEKLKDERCFVGMDLSSTTDITALVSLFPPGPYEEWTIVPRFFIPEDNIREATARDKVPYQDWVDAGLVETTPGDSIDLAFVKKEFLDLSSFFDVTECDYDSWSAKEIAASLESEGATMVEIRQGHATLYPGVNALHQKLAKGQIRHGGNPVLRWMASNCTGRADPNGNLIPDKRNSYSRIDGISALMNAFSRAIGIVEDESSTYQDKGVVFL